MPDIYVAPEKEERQPKAGLPQPEKKREEKEEQKGGSLSAFIAYPYNVRFDTQA